jgi:hypothetical protein
MAGYHGPGTIPRGTFFQKNPAALKMEDNALFLSGEGFSGGNDFILLIMSYSVAMKGVLQHGAG